MGTKLTKQYDSIKEVDPKYKWDLSFLLTNKTPQERLKELTQLWKMFLDQNDKQYTSAANFLKSLQLEDEIIIKDRRFSAYLSLALSINVVDNEILLMQQQYEYEAYKFREQLGPTDAVFFANADKIAKWISGPEFDPYRFKLAKKLEEKDHALMPAIEEFRRVESRADVSALEVFDIIERSELDYGFALDKRGRKIPVTSSNYSELMKHDDKRVRHTAQVSYRNAYLVRKGSLASLLYQHKKSESTWAKITKFSSAVSSLIFSDRVPEEFLKTLFNVVKKHKEIFEPYRQYYKKFYKAKFKETATRWDYNRELVKFSKKYTVEEAQKEILVALKPFGTAYTDVVKKAFKEGWIDYMPVKNKYTGAFCIGGATRIEKKLILMNWDGELRSVETLVHELGHALHSHFAEISQPVRTVSYPILLAEVASILNEVLLIDYWLITSKSDEQKFQALERVIDGFRGTVMQQVEWAEFEHKVYEKLDAGEPVGTFEALTQIYRENARQYALNSTKEESIEFQSYNAIRVPHFYYGFYVYKYAIGQLVASIIHERFKQGGTKVLEDYIDNFLRMGGSMNPLDVFKNIGVDLMDEDTYTAGFDTMKTNIEEWIKLGRKIFKV